MSIDDEFIRVDPDSYNRLTHPSLKQFHDFVSWLKENTGSELDAAKGHPAATREAWLRFFRRGLKADLLLDELMQLVRPILIRTYYNEPERQEVIRMLKQLNLKELGIKCDEDGVRFDDQAS